MPARSHVGWGLLLSLLLHATGITALTLALPRLNVRPGVVRPVDFAVASFEPADTPHTPDAPEAATPAAEQPARPDAPATPAITVEVTEDKTANVELSPAQTPTPSPVAAPKPARKTAPKPLTAAAPLPQPKAAKPTAATPSELPSSSRADPRSDGSALERVLRQIASTTELSQDERRRAMMLVLRTWEDPSGKHSAEQLVDALIKNARQNRPDAGK